MLSSDALDITPCKQYMVLGTPSVVLNSLSIGHSSVKSSTRTRPSAPRGRLGLMTSTRINFTLSRPTLSTRAFASYLAPHQMETIASQRIRRTRTPRNPEAPVTRITSDCIAVITGQGAEFPRHSPTLMIYGLRIPYNMITMTSAITPSLQTRTI